MKRPTITQAKRLCSEMGGSVRAVIVLALYDNYFADVVQQGLALNSYIDPVALALANGIAAGLNPTMARQKLGLRVR